METEIYIISSWGYREITFKKTFKLPFTPFIGMTIIEENEDGDDNSIEFCTNEYYDTRIYFYTKTQSFDVELRRNWGKFGIRSIAIKDHIERFESFGWKIQENENQVKEMLDWANIEEERKLKKNLK